MPNKKILVVDDEISILNLMKALLAETGYEVTGVQTREQAMQALAASSYQVVLLDYTLKEESGLEVLKAIKKNYPSLPVIIVTGCYDETVARLSFEWGALEYLTKPVDLEVLLRILETQISDNKAA